MLEDRQSFLGNVATIEGDEEERARGSREEKEKPCLQWRDLAGLPLLCLSGSGLQRQRKSRNVQAWWWWWMGKSSASAPERRERKSTLKRVKTRRLKGLLWKQQTKQAIFSFLNDITHPRHRTRPGFRRQCPVIRPVILSPTKSRTLNFFESPNVSKLDNDGCLTTSSQRKANPAPSKRFVYESLFGFRNQIHWITVK